MVLGHNAIVKAITEGRIKIASFPTDEHLQKAWIKKHVQPASIDLPIGSEFAYILKENAINAHGQVKVYPDQLPVIETTAVASEQFIKVAPNLHNGWPLPPGKTILVPTEDSITFGPDLAGQVATRSTARRWGLDVCGSAGWVDPGFSSKICLEIHNTTGRTIMVRPGVCYAQLILFNVEDAGKTYKGHYNNEAFTPESILPKSL